MWYFTWKYPFIVRREPPKVVDAGEQKIITRKALGYNLRRQAGIRQWFAQHLGASTTASYASIERAIALNVPENERAAYHLYLTELKMHEQALREKE